MTSSRVIGVLHPGEMGSVVGRCLAERGHRVLWTSQGRGPQSAARAAAAGLADIGDVAALVSQADVIVSICPPHAAVDVATAVSGFAGLYVDANAISPQTARELARIVQGGGATYVDGGIVGPPPAAAGSTRLYLSGQAAETARELFDGTAIEARVLTGDPWAASSIKMAYAAWTKGSAALLLAVRALADARGVSDALLAEWEISQPGLRDRHQGAAQAAASKGWRWTAEMEEIAATMAAAGLPDGFHLAAAEIYRRSPHPIPGRPSIARIYDYWLGGKDNFAWDREAAEQAMAANPGIVADVRANRAFLARAVTWLATEHGVRQFLDIGSGLPTARNTHQVAQAVAPSSRVVYVDNDPTVLAAARELLTSAPEGTTAYLDNDLRDVDQILRGAAATLDLSAPVAVLLPVVLHLIGAEDDPWGIVTRLMSQLAPGSFLVLTHPASDVRSDAMAELASRVNSRLTSAKGTMRNRAEITRFFDGLDLLEPGVVQPQQWHPEATAAEPDVTAWCGVARKPS